MSVETFVAFDTETTGLSPVGDRIVEIAAVAFGREGSTVATFERLVDPGIPIPAELTLIHGINDEMVAGMPRIEQVLPDFLRFIAGSVLIAHNAPYDISMLLVPMVRMSRMSTAASLPLVPPGNVVLDTCALARFHFPGAPNYRLGTIADLLGIPRGRAHRAMPDVGACKDLFLRILSKCPPGIPLPELVRMNGPELRFATGDERLIASGFDPRAEVLRHAMRTATPVLIEYLGGTHGAGPRLVTPIMAAAQGPMSFLIGHCHLDGGLKSFRMDRIAAVYPLPVS